MTSSGGAGELEALAELDAWIALHQADFAAVLNRALLSRYVSQGRATSYDTYAETIKSLNEAKSAVVQLEGEILRAKADGDAVRAEKTKLEEQTSTQIKDLKDETEKSMEGLKGKEDKITELEGRMMATSTDLAEKEERIVALQAKLSDDAGNVDKMKGLEEEVGRLKKELEECRQSLDSLSTDMEEQKVHYQQRLDAKNNIIKGLQEENQLIEEQERRPAKKR